MPRQRKEDSSEEESDQGMHHQQLQQEEERDQFELEDGEEEIYGESGENEGDEGFVIYT